MTPKPTVTVERILGHQPFVRVTFPLPEPTRFLHRVNGAIVDFESGPETVRELASALLRAADEVEGKC